MRKTAASIWRVFKNSIFFPSKAKPIVDKEPSQPGSPLFVVIHGTWARDEQWTKIDADLGEGGIALGTELTRAFPHAGWVRFKWHAYNGARARANAARDLAGAFDELRVQFPRTRLVAIAHSHGGNVLAWASTVVNEPIDHAVYLNTPFFHIRDLDTRPSDAIHPISRWFSEATQQRSGRLFSLAAMAAIPASFGFWWILDHWCGLSEDAAIAGLFINLILILVFLLFARGALLRFVRPTADTMRQFLSSPRRVRRELSVFCVGDEAALGLTTAAGIRHITRITAMIVGAIFLLCALVEGVLRYSVMGDDFFDFSQQGNEFPLWMILELGAIISGFTIVAIGEALASLSQGFQQAVISVDSDITVSPAPAGTVEFLTIPWPKSPDAKGIHSSIVSSREVVYELSKALQERLGVAQGEV